MTRSLLCLIVMLFGINLYCQDTIVKIDGDRIVAKVKTVKESEITYTRYGNPDGPEYTLSLDEIWKIIYADGTVETYGQPISPRKSEEPGEPNIPSTMIGITLTDFIPGQITVSFEQFILKNQLSFRIPLSLGVYNLAGRQPKDFNSFYYYDRFKKVSVGFDLLYYAQRTGKSAYFLGATIETGNGSYGITDSTSSLVTVAKYNYFGLGITNGFRFYPNGRVNITLFGSIGMQLMSNNEDYRALGRGGIIMGFTM